MIFTLNNQIQPVCLPGSSVIVSNAGERSILRDVVEGHFPLSGIYFVNLTHLSSEPGVHVWLWVTVRHTLHDDAVTYSY